MSGTEDLKEQADLFDISVTDLLIEMRDAYQEMEISIRRYVIIAIIPSIFLFFASILAALLAPLPLIARIPMPLLGILGIVVSIFYPKIRKNQKQKQIKNYLPLMVTHMAVLASTDIDRIEVFQAISKEREYGILADEMGKVVDTVNTWNQSLDEACRKRANEITDEQFSDFLDRLAYSIGAGNELKDFLVNEQDIALENYKTYYESSLGNLSVLKDLYLSMILSLTFALVFVIVLPVLTGTDPFPLIATVIILFTIIQLGFYFSIRSVVPTDPLWHNNEEVDTIRDKKSRIAIIGGLTATGLLAILSFLDYFAIFPLLSIILFFLGEIQLQLYAAITVTPLLIPGLYYHNEGKRIISRDTQYPGFIRALGSTESAKQSTTSTVLKSLRKKEFGELNENIENLYRRLNIRIETQDAWNYFTAECRSYLIHKFSEMYMVGRGMGGEPKSLGEMISENMSEINQLRNIRRQEGVTIIGVLYGITAASTFAFFIALTVVEILSNLSLNISGNFAVGQIIHTNIYNVELIRGLLVVIIMINAVISGLMIRAVDGRHNISSFLHLVALIWVSTVVSIVTQIIVSSVISV